MQLLHNIASLEEARAILLAVYGAKNIDGTDVTFRPVSPVAATDRMLGLHTELGYFPSFMPKFLALYCERPAMCQGGQTLVCDGQEVYRRLMCDVPCMEHHTLKFSRNFPKAVLSQLLGKAETHLVSSLSQVAKVKETVEEIVVNTEVPLVSSFGTEKYFSNSLHAGTLSKGYGMTTALPETYVSICNKVILDTCQVVDWKAKQLVIIDNHKYMHGRLPFTDTKRLLRVAFIY